MSIDVLKNIAEHDVKEYKFTEGNLTAENITIIKKELADDASFSYISKKTGVSIYFIKKIYNGEKIKPRKKNEN